jgi:hypothetical protein
MTGVLRWLAAGLLTLEVSALPVMAQDTGYLGPAVLPLPEQAEGVAISSVTVKLRISSGDAGEDQAALAAARKLLAALEGEPFSRLVVTRLVAALQSDKSIAKADYRLLLLGGENGLKIAFEIDAAAAAKPPPDAGIGVLAGDIGSFPVLYKDERTLLTAIVAGGLGVYSDGNAWFGRPDLFIPTSPSPPGERATWTEGSLEAGLGGATQLGDSNFYAFGAITGMATWSLGQDFIADQTRTYHDIEKAYAGLLYANRDTRTVAKLSAGRQTFTLNDGFLVNMVRGSANGGDRGAAYLGPRLASDFSVLANGRIGKAAYNLFYIDPNEIETRETDSTFLGANAKYNINDNLALDATVITIPTSLSTYANPNGLNLPREGLNTVSGHLKWRNLLGLDGAWFEGEAAHQSHPDYAMSASAYYGTLGYIARKAPWTPSISYRYAYFSGDDPNTTRYERYDPLMNTGLGIWLQGVSFGKLMSNSNLATHRVQLNIAPMETLNLTADYHLLRAPQLNNLGSSPAIALLKSHDIGQEFTLSARWAINKNFYLQSLASCALPGKALRDIGAGKAWSTFQVSLYWGL